MAVMVQSGLAQSISSGFVAIASAESLPFWSFISAGVVNIFVPSGGGQWAVQAPIMLPAAEALGADVARVAMAVAWGCLDQPDPAFLGAACAGHCRAQGPGYHGFLPDAVADHRRGDKCCPQLVLGQLCLLILDIQALVIGPTESEDQQQPRNHRR